MPRLAWCFLVIIIDGYDLAVAGAALPAIMKEMGVEAATAGFMASSALFGMMFGAIFLGALSDKIGRRWTISLCVFLFSVFTAAAGLTRRRAPDHFPTLDVPGPELRPHASDFAGNDLCRDVGVCYAQIVDGNR